LLFWAGQPHTVSRPLRDKPLHASAQTNGWAGLGDALMVGVWRLAWGGGLSCSRTSWYRLYHHKGDNQPKKAKSMAEEETIATRLV